MEDVCRLSDLSVINISLNFLFLVKAYRIYFKSNFLTELCNIFIFLLSMLVVGVGVDAGRL